MRNEKAKADSEPGGKRWVRNDSRSVEWVGFCAAVLAVEIEDAALKDGSTQARRIIRVSIIHARRMERAVTEAGGNV